MEILLSVFCLLALLIVILVPNDNWACVVICVYSIFLYITWLFRLIEFPDFLHIHYGCSRVYQALSLLLWLELRLLALVFWHSS